MISASKKALESSPNDLEAAQSVGARSARAAVYGGEVAGRTAYNAAGKIARGVAKGMLSPAGLGESIAAEVGRHGIEQKFMDEYHREDPKPGRVKPGRTKA